MAMKTRWITGALIGLIGTGCAEEAPPDPPLAEPQPHCVTNDTAGETDLTPADFPDPGEPGVDYDCDRYPVEVDCDDQNPDVHPDAEEYNNGLDDNCDGDPGELYGCFVTSYDGSDAGTSRRASAGLALLFAAALRRRGGPAR